MRHMFISLLTGPLKNKTNPSALCGTNGGDDLQFFLPFITSHTIRSSASGAPRCRTSSPNLSQRSRTVPTERQNNGLITAKSLGCKFLGVALTFEGKGSAWKYKKTHNFGVFFFFFQLSSFQEAGRRFIKPTAQRVSPGDQRRRRRRRLISPSSLAALPRLMRHFVPICSIR